MFRTSGLYSPKGEYYLFYLTEVTQSKITMQVKMYILKNNKITRTGLESYSEAHWTLHSLMTRLEIQLFE